MDPPGPVEGRRLQKPSKRSADREVYRPQGSIINENRQLRAIFKHLGEISLDPRPGASANLPHSVPVAPAAKLNTRCSCGNVADLSSLRGQRHSNGGDSDSDGEDDGSVSLVAVIRMLVVQERKGSARQHGAIKNLADCCRGDVTSETHLRQLFRLTSSTVRPVKQAAFFALRQAATNEANAKTLLRMSVVPQLLTLLQDEMEAASHSTAAAVLEKIVTHRKLADHWLEPMITRGLSILIGSLSSANQAAETKVALGRLLGNLAGFFEIAVLLLDHCMEDIAEMWSSYPAMKECLTELFGRLVQHTDHTIAGVLEHRVMERVAAALKEENCGVQIKAAEFFQALCRSDYGLSAFLDDGKLRGLLQVLRTTHCRRLRELCMSSLTSTLQRSSRSQLRDVTVHAEAAFGGSSSVEREDPGGGRRLGEAGQGNPASRRKDAGGRRETGVEIIVSVLVETIHKEAKMSLDQNRKVKSVGFRPGVDLFKTLSDAVRCLGHMATMSDGSHRRRMPSRNAGASVVGSNGMARNPDVVLAMYRQGALCVLNLLDAYTAHLFPNTGARHSQPQQQRNVDVLHLQAMMKVWRAASPAGPARPLPRAEELQFVRQLVECAHLFCRRSARLWNCRVATDVQSQIRDAPDRTGDLAASERCPGGQYRYVKTVDQDFPASCKIESMTTHRQQEKDIQEQRRSAIPQRRMAWGDNKEQKLSEGGPSSHQFSKNPAGDSPKVANGARPSSAKKRHPETEIRFDLSKSHFREGAKPAPPSKLREAPGVAKNARTAGYAERAAPALARAEGEDEHRSVIADEEKAVHKKLRSRLFQEGAYRTVGPWVACGVPQIQAIAADCLRYFVQPLDPEENQSLRESAQAKERYNRHKSRAEMAETLAERDKILSQVLGQMSSGSADVVRDALGVKGQADGEPGKQGKGTKLQTKPLSKPTNHKPTPTSDEPIGWQCSIHLLEASGSQILEGLRSDCAETRRACLLLVYDLADFGEIVIHMKLASLGVVSQLMDFLRSNRQQQDLALLAVMTLSRLICDFRLKQMFCSEGGEALLTGLIQTSEGALLMHLHQFRRRIAKGPGGIL